MTLLPHASNRADSLPVVAETVESERAATVGESPDEKIGRPAMIAPGLPPLLNFRVYESRQRGRSNGSELMLDDAGH